MEAVRQWLVGKGCRDLTLSDPKNQPYPPSPKHNFLDSGGGGGQLLQKHGTQSAKCQGADFKVWAFWVWGPETLNITKCTGSPTLKTLAAQTFEATAHFTDTSSSVLPLLHPRRQLGFAAASLDAQAAAHKF